MNNEKMCFIDKIPDDIPEDQILHGIIDFGSCTYFAPGDQCEDWVRYFDSFYENTPKLLITNCAEHVNNLFYNNVDEKDKYLFEYTCENKKNEDIFYHFHAYIVDISVSNLNIEFPKLWPSHCRNENDIYFLYDKIRNCYIQLTNN